MILRPSVDERSDEQSRSSGHTRWNLRRSRSGPGAKIRPVFGFLEVKKWARGTDVRTCGHSMAELVARIVTVADQAGQQGNGGGRSRGEFCFTHNPPFSQWFGIPARQGRTGFGSAQTVARVV